MGHKSNDAAAGKHKAGPSSRIETITDPTQVRNVVLVGHSGAGKTTLIEALLAATETIPRAGSVEDGTTVTDHDPCAIKQQRSVSLAVAPLLFDGVKINLLDTPGYGDFVGELRAGLRAADAALFVVSAVDGVDAATITLWDECAKVGMPRAVVVTSVDHPRADFDAIVAICQRVFGDGVSPLCLPIHDDEDEEHPIVGVIDMLRRHISDYRSSEFPPPSRRADAEHDALIDDARNTLIEGIIAESEDETLMDRYLAGEVADSDDDVAMLIKDLERAVARGTFYPVLPTAVFSTGDNRAHIGLAEVLAVITRGFPSPSEHEPPVVTHIDDSPHAPITSQVDGPLVAEVVKTTVDPYVGRVCIVRVFSGTLRPDTPIHICGHGLADRGHPDHDSDDRAGRIYSPLGGELREVDSCVAGDICALTKLVDAETGDTISEKDHPVRIAAWPMPEPLLPIAIVAKTRSDEDALAKNLTRLISGDPTLRLDRNDETGQLVLWCLGEAHADVMLERLRAGGVDLEIEPVKVALRQTFTKLAKGHGRHVKQSGGHGQYAVCDIEVRPLPRGGGFEFTDKIVGGVINHQFISSVEKGIRAQLAQGISGGPPIVDIGVRLVDGKMHSVDSSDAAFQAAGAAALRDAAAQGDVTVLEPFDTVAVTVPDIYVGAVMSDISARRGRIAGTTPDETEEHTVIAAELPAAELSDYTTRLRSLSSGTATFTRTFLRYEPAAS